MSRIQPHTPRAAAIRSAQRSRIQPCHSSCEVLGPRGNACTREHRGRHITSFSHRVICKVLWLFFFFPRGVACKLPWICWMPLAEPWQPIGAPPAAGAAGSAHGCHLPFVKHPEGEANSPALLNPNTHSNALNTNQPHARRVHPNHLPAPQPWPTVTSEAGTALLFYHLLQPPVSRSSRSKAELQDARCSCGNHPRRDGILPLVWLAVCWKQ